MPSRLAVAIALVGIAIDAGSSADAGVARRCLRGVDRAGVAAAAATGRALARCVQAASRGRLASGTSIGTCATDEARSAVSRIRTKAERIARRVCGDAPGFDRTSAAQTVDAFAAMLHPDSVFGPDVTAFISRRTDTAGAACQAAVARGMVRVTTARLREFDRCRAAALRAPAAPASLAACLESDPRGRVARVRRAAERVAEARCGSTPVATACPGECAHASLEGLFECLERRAACDVCLAVDTADAVGASCQRYVDGVATPYCGLRPATAQTVARQWDEETLAAIRLDTPRPTVHARNLFHVSVAMWDAWAAYDRVAAGYVVTEKRASDDAAADRAATISFAAYRVLRSRFGHAVGAERSLASFDARMATLGFDPSFTDASGASAAALGNRIAAAVIATGLADGANEQDDYKDPSYAPLNPPLIVKQPGDPPCSATVITSCIVDPARWQPLALDQVTQNGIALPDKVQTYVGSHWGGVAPFALVADDPRLDVAPPPALDGATDADYRAMHRALILLSSRLTPDDGATVDLSPAVHGNWPVDADGTPLPTDDEATAYGPGYGVNPVTGAAYPPEIVKRGDWGRVIAEFWADGPNSETPPGHWNVIANQVSDALGAQKRFRGTGDVLDPLEWDVKLYLATNGAVHDAAVAAWGIKRRFDAERPISAIRYMADSATPASDRLPLEDGLVETITSETTMPGARHAALVGHEGEVAVLAWPGQPADPTTQYSGAQWILGATWVPYQKSTFVTPAFASYISGHSTFSRAAAEVLSGFTGSPYFPGGRGEFVAPRDAFLKFERGPTTDVVLQWASYFDAANEAGLSRRWGGIHIEADDYIGRRIGHWVGIGAFEKAARYFAGSP